ncbi:hypothetical protein [Stenotrophomonas maltophilia]|uniref:hypothetical protein n=1 Tax=Stenotrophomonas maltophilia TaxID=40324 RepID=UPI0015F21731|nr:hypothetical protein [Stenotrophomonas maltophilia]QDY49822.1 hypothetical protein DUW70_15410 [Stenotrophomonas maltophilia]
MNDVNKVCSCPSGDGSLRHPCPAHSPWADVQPGGMVRLGDQACDWRFSEWWSGLPQDIGVLYPYDIAKLAWQAALSAQPSPGGQGDALAALWEKWEVAALSGGSSARHYVAAMHECAAELKAALAARQPVEMTEGTMRAAASRQTASAESNATAEALIAWARQPVGEPDEPIFQVKHHDDTEATWRDATEAAYEMQPAALRRIVYTAPPAQAVDLGTLITELAEADREYAEAKKRYHTVSAKSGAAGGRASCRAAYDREITAKRRLDSAVRALIDSQVVGNG